MLPEDSHFKRTTFRGSGQAFPSTRDEYGERFVVDFMMEGPTGRARDRSSWLIRAGEVVPRLITCYVL